VIRHHFGTDTDPTFYFDIAQNQFRRLVLIHLCVFAGIKCIPPEVVFLRNQEVNFKDPNVPQYYSMSDPVSVSTMEVLILDLAE
jgi:hypothetical protein